MTTTTNAADTALKTLLANAGKLGEAEGKGINARPALAIAVAEASHDGTIAPDSDDLKVIWQRFVAGKTNGSTTATTTNTDGATASDDVQISKLRSFAKAAHVTRTPAMGGVNFADVLKRALPLVNTAAGAKGSTYDRLIQVARAQVGTKDNPPTRALTDNDILAAVSPKDKDEKDELATLKAIVQSMDKLINGTKATDKSPAKPGYGTGPRGEAYVKAGQLLAAALAELEDEKATLELIAKRQAVQGRFTLIPAQPKH